MKAIEFRGTLAPNGQIDDIAHQLSNEDIEWRVAGRRQFEAAYVPDNSLYEQLTVEASTR